MTNAVTDTDMMSSASVEARSGWRKVAASVVTKINMGGDSQKEMLLSTDNNSLCIFLTVYVLIREEFTQENNECSNKFQQQQKVWMQVTRLNNPNLSYTFSMLV